MKTKHTKGQWNITGKLDNLAVTVTYNEGQDNELTQRIASVTGYDHLVPQYEEAEANAKLITAAPELLEALNKTLSYLNHDEGKEPSGLRLTDVYRLIESAIEKATI